MKFSDIVGLFDYFEPFYDLTQEHATYWKQFVPTNKFYDILRTALDSLGGHDPQIRKSIWIQGTYGTGKSHATAVIKHLLSDPEGDLLNFYPCLENAQVRERIKNFRKTNSIFPVILKGVSNITDTRTFSLVVERAVKRSLKDSGVELKTQSDFENMSFHVRDNALIDWDHLINETPDLRMLLRTKNDLIKKLQINDIAVLRTHETALNDKGVHISYSAIDKWLAEIQVEIREHNLGNALVLFWDEFTSVLELQNRSSLLNQLQSIAELSKHSNVFLFIVSHRKPSQAGLSDDDVKKVFDRFHLKDYSMEPITTFQIISPHYS